MAGLEKAERSTNAGQHALRNGAGATSPNHRVEVTRVLSPLVEPGMSLLR